MPPAVTTLSTKGQVILPKAIRDRKGWDSGARLVVEETPDGVLLKRAPVFAPTTMAEVFGVLKWDGPPKTINEMDEGIMEAVRHHAGD